MPYGFILLAMNTPNAVQALNNLYAAARRAPLNADDHEMLKKCAEQVYDLIKPKDDKVVDFDGKSP